MNWSLCRLVLQLKAPLYIGMPPAGSLNRCRLYVPARNLWGSLTAELAQRQATSFPGYAKVGGTIRKDVRLTCLYPAEPTDRGWRAWLPKYEDGVGLTWRREDSQSTQAGLPDREMRRRLLLARPGTAIDHSSAAAEEGTLRETECIGEHWRDIENGQANPVAMIGYVFLREGSALGDQVKQIETLFLGGDTRYGLGRARRIEMSVADTVFGAPVELSGNDPSVSSLVLYGHGTTSTNLKGARELVVGWDSARDADVTPLAPTPLWVPGSSANSHTPMWWWLNEDGFWIQAEISSP